MIKKTRLVWSCWTKAVFNFSARLLSPRRHLRLPIQCLFFLVRQYNNFSMDLKSLHRSLSIG